MIWGMECLRTYLANLKPDEQADYARRAGTTIGYLRKALSKGQRFDGALARLLDEQSGGAVPREDLRPDIWPPAASNDDPDAGRVQPFVENP